MKKRIVILFLGSVWTLGNIGWCGASELDEMKAEMRALRTRAIELEARLEQYEHGGHDVHAHNDHEERGSHEGDEGFDIEIGHHNHHLDFRKIHVHGGVDLRYLNVDEGEHKLFLHEAEIGIGAELTEWFDALLTVTKHHGENMEVEQGYGKLKFKEINTVVKGGKFFVNFGPENRVGFYDRRTVTPSAMRQGFFGNENWTDEGLEVSYKLPMDFNSIMTVGALNGNNEKTFGDDDEDTSEANNNFPVVVNLHNQVETEEWGEFTFGGSYTQGKWDAEDDWDVSLYGADLGWKLGNFDFQGEYMFRNKELSSGNVKGAGFYVLGAYKVPLEWEYLDHIELLLAYGESNPDDTTKEKRYSPQLTFQLNEMAKFRLLYDIRQEKPADADNNRLIAQFAYHF